MEFTFTKFSTLNSFLAVWRVLHASESKLGRSPTRKCMAKLNFVPCGCDRRRENKFLITVLKYFTNSVHEETVLLTTYTQNRYR